MKSSLILFLFCFYSTFSIAQTKPLASDNLFHTKADSITDKFVKEFFFNSHSVGLSIGIYFDGQFCTYNYGETNKITHNLPTANTLYNLASITKTITGVLLAQAQIEGKLNIDDDIRKHLKGSFPNLEYDGHPIKIYQLLNHTSGLPFFLPNKPNAFNDTTISPNLISAQLLKNYSRQNFYEDLRKVKLDTIPGLKEQYSNAAGQLAGYILENIYSKTYESLVKMYLKKLAKMNDTKITITPSDKTRFASGYDKFGNETSPGPDQFQAAGSLKSTVNDMLKYIKWQLNEKNKVVQLTHKPTTSISKGGFSVGLNWSMYKTTKDIRVIWQNGNVPGASSWCILYPELKMGIILFTNQTDQTSSHRLAVLGESIMISLNSNAPEF
ncbi:serine hydrolase domain-containing protein [Runella sp.]|uniref:serine hydrolase domain-containing protein n=1 Tax=Runella sp. TaxID=1960881 RepID=UPI003D0E77B7